MLCGYPTSQLALYQQVYADGVSPLAQTVEGEGWNIRCKAGYSWTDGTVKYINCTAKGWSSFPVICSGLL